MRKKKLNRSRRVEGTPDVSLIEMESSYVFSATTMRTLIAQKGSGNAGNTRRCFLFVFPSSEVIDERLGATSVDPKRLAA